MNIYNYKIAESIGGRKEQQDFAGAATTKLGLLVVVCDGMGGAKGGATASRMAVNIILQDISNSNYNSPSIALLESLKKANAEIFNRSRTDENCKGMGTTATAIILQKEKATIAHVGDSRIYQLRSPNIFSKTIKKVFRTNDHSKVFELVKRGILNEEQARVSDESNVILRALGIKSEVDVEVSDNISYLKGDRFLLCTDGICGAVPEKELLEMLNQKSDIEFTANKLVSEIDKIGYNNGGEHDNLTVAIIECNTNSTLKTKIDMNTKILIASLAALLILSLGYISYTKLSGTTTKSEFESLKQDNERVKKQVDSLFAANKLLADSLNQEKQKVENIDKVLHPSKDKHDIPSSQSTGENLLNDANSILQSNDDKTKNKTKPTTPVAPIPKKNANTQGEKNGKPVKDSAGKQEKNQ